MSGKRARNSISRRASRRKDAEDDNLHVYLSISPKNLTKNAGREEARSEKSRSLPASAKSTKRVPLIGVEARSRSGALTSGLPEAVAVHFGKFYGSVSNPGERCQDGRTTKSEFPASQTPRFEFTRQMVHELERLAGTEQYARQVSALLDSTVESPNFNVKPPPVDNFIIHESSESWDYPLWYKEPDKMTSLSIVESEENQTRKPRNKCVVMNSVRSIVSGGFVDVDADYVNNDETLSSSSSSDLGSASEANTEEDW